MILIAVFVSLVNLPIRLWSGPRGLASIVVGLVYLEQQAVGEKAAR